jgi:hypothetical protein
MTDQERAVIEAAKRVRAYLDEYEARYGAEDQIDSLWNRATGDGTAGLVLTPDDLRLILPPSD